MLKEGKVFLVVLTFLLISVAIYENYMSGSSLFSAQHWNIYSLQWLTTRGNNSVQSQEGQTMTESKQLGPNITAKKFDPNILAKTGNCSWTNTTKVLKPCFYRTGQELHNSSRPVLHFATVACGGRFDEGLVLLKSVVALTTASHVVLHIFTERSQMSRFRKALHSWPRAVLERVEYRLYPPTYPREVRHWKNKFGNCASQRLLFASLLMEVEAVVYVDADAVLLSPLDKVWRYFSRFNSTQMLALVAEHEDAAVSWYRKNSRIPYFLPFGLNSGVALMNLTRMRRVNFTETIVKYAKKYGGKLRWFDQDLLNIFARFNPALFYKLDCSVNYRGDHCRGRLKLPRSSCHVADTGGVHVLHGSKRVFHRDAALNAVYQAFRKVNLNGDVQTGLLRNLTKNLAEVKVKSPCKSISHIFPKHILELVGETDAHY